MRLRKSKLEPNGYAVTTPDKDSVIYEDHALEWVRKSCRPGRIVVRRYRYVSGWTIKISFYPNFWEWKFKNAIRLKYFTAGFFIVSWNKEYANHYGETVFENLSEES